MKVTIKTAHGYLSFQPDGRLEYRLKAGPWEEIEIEGLALEPVAPPGQPPKEPPIDDEGPEPSQSAEYVAAVKAGLEADGVSLLDSCGAFEITKRVAWGLRGDGIGLVSKPTGNNCAGYSVDYLCYSNGDGVDILGDAGGRNTPQWAVKEGEFDRSRWRAPIQP